jgi:hypothetical protein
MKRFSNMVSTVPTPSATVLAPQLRLHVMGNAGDGAGGCSTDFAALPHVDFYQFADSHLGAGFAQLRRRGVEMFGLRSSSAPCLR